MKKRNVLKWVLLVSVGLFIGAYVVNSQLSSSTVKDLAASDHYRDGRFHNTVPRENPGFLQILGIIKDLAFQQRVDTEPSESLPIQVVTRAQLDGLSNEELYLIKLGHSSMLLKVYGEYWLIDPVFSKRASPFSFSGPARFHPVPITVAELPPIERVLISHNHYDHLDRAAIQELAPKTQQFLVPLGNAGDLQKWGVDQTKIISFDWWQELKTDNALLAFTPTQHFSSRSLSDRNMTLWGSWVIKTEEQSLYFSSDSGYFDGFKKIGEKYGPFDLTMIETGAYNTRWPDVHMMPEESVQAHLDLQGVTMLPIHNSTFNLSTHAWYDPLERVSLAAKKQQVHLTTPIVGEVFTAKQAAISNLWWKTLMGK